jgi:hypothetical protein
VPCVIDLNAVRTACLGVNPYGIQDLSAQALASDIEKTCDTLFISTEIHFRYYAILDELKQGRETPPSVAGFFSLYRDWAYRDKVAWKALVDMPELPAVSGVSAEDAPYVRLMLGTGSVLATYDGKLLEIGRARGWPIMLPDAAKAKLVKKSSSESTRTVPH